MVAKRRICGFIASPCMHSCSLKLCFFFMSSSHPRGCRNSFVQAGSWFKQGRTSHFLARLSKTHMKKRKSQGSLDNKAAKSSKGPPSGRADPDKLAGSPHIALMTDWFLAFLD